MKVLSVFLFNLALLPAATANNLRQAPAPQEVYDNLSPKAAPAEWTPRSFAAQHRDGHRRLDAATINSAVAAALPTINTAFQSALEDPLTISDVSYTYTYNDGSTCSGNDITATSSLTQLTGLKTTEITTLEVDDDTDTLTFDCWTGVTTFTGDFNFVGSASEYALTGNTAFAADTCTSANSDYTGTVTNPKLTGVIYMEGTVSANSASITKAEVKSITATCDSTAVAFSGSLGDFANAAAGAETEVGDDLKSYVSTTVTTLIKDAINTAISNAVAFLGLGGGVPFMLAGYRSNAAGRIATLQAEAGEVLVGWQNQVTNWQSKGQNFIGKLGFSVGGPGP